MIQTKEHMEVVPWNSAMIWPKKGNGEYDGGNRPIEQLILQWPDMPKE